MTPNSAHPVSPAIPCHRVAGGEEGEERGGEGWKEGEEGGRGREVGGRGGASVAGQLMHARLVAMETRRVSTHESSEMEEDEDEVTTATPHPVYGEL